MNILIVDDEFLIRTSLQLYLEDAGISPRCIFQADHADAMLNILKKTPIDLAFVDIRMPGLDGLSAIAVSDSLNLETHFYVLTGYSEFEYAHRALRLHIEDYLLKPVSPNQIKEILQKEEKFFRLKQIRKQQEYLHTLYQSLNDRPAISKNISAALVCFIGKSNINEFHELIDFIRNHLESYGYKRFIQCSFLSWEFFIFNEQVNLDELPGLLSSRLRQIGSSIFYKTLSKDICLTLQTVQKESFCMIAAPLRTFYTTLSFSKEIEKITHYFAKLLYWSSEKNYDQFNLSAQKLVTMVNQAKLLKETSALSQIILLLSFYFSDESYAEILPEELSRILHSYSSKYLLNNNESDNSMDSIHEYIEMHFQEKITLTSLADKFGYTPNYISSSFRKKFGLTVIQYLNQIRLLHACQLLTQTNMNIQEVAESIGFSDGNYFTRIFTREYHISPSAYRKSHC